MLVNLSIMFLFLPFTHAHTHTHTHTHNMLLYQNAISIVRVHLRQQSEHRYSKHHGPVSKTEAACRHDFTQEKRHKRITKRPGRAPKRDTVYLSTFTAHKEKQDGCCHLTDI